MNLKDELKDCTKIQAWNKGYAEGSSDQAKLNSGAALTDAITWPTDYDVWRDAMTMALKDQNGDHWTDEMLRKRIDFFWNLLQEVPAREVQE
jgi:hypothetical protein